MTQQFLTNNLKQNFRLMRKLRILLIVAFLAAIFIIGQSIYWESEASQTEYKSLILTGILHDDMKRAGDNWKPDSALIKGQDEMSERAKSQHNKSILFKWFGWQVF